MKFENLLKKFILLFSVMFNIQSFEFKGRHFIAAYCGCRSDIIRDKFALFMGLYCACLEAGAHVVSWTTHEFPNGACTIYLCLSESHATIHTYPEYNSCFVDFFTCGDKCDPEVFNNFMSNYLGALQVDGGIVSRGG